MVEFLLLLVSSTIVMGSIPSGKDLLIQEYSSNSKLLVTAISNIFEECFLHRNGSVYITIEGTSNRTLKSTNDKFEIITALVRQLQTTKYQIMSYDKLNDNKRFFNLIIVESYDSFKKICNAITSTKFHLQGKFLIVFTNHQENAFKHVERICLDLWNKVIINVHVLIKTLQVDEARLYTFFPYNKKSCGEAHPILWKTFKHGKFHNKRKLFPHNLVTFKNCPLNVATFDALPFMRIKKSTDGKISYDGLDGMLMQTLADKIHFSINLTYIDDSDVQWGEILPNGSSTGAMKMVK